MVRLLLRFAGQESSDEESLAESDEDEDNSEFDEDEEEEGKDWDVRPALLLRALMLAARCGLTLSDIAAGACAGTRRGGEARRQECIRRGAERRRRSQAQRRREGEGRAAHQEGQDLDATSLAKFSVAKRKCLRVPTACYLVRAAGA